MTFSYYEPFSRNSKLTLIDRINNVKEHTSGDAIAISYLVRTVFAPELPE